MEIKLRKVYRWMLVVSIMALFLSPLRGCNETHYAIHENSQTLVQPTSLWGGFIKREWQPFLEQRFLSHIGNLRSFLILSYNEARHRIFPTRPNDGYIWTPKLGYYPVDTIRRLNEDVLRHDAIEQHYQRAARRLKILQEILSHYGVAMVVVTPPPKARIYPEYIAPYLIAPADSIMSQAVSYGDVLEKNGVNVLNVQRTFLEHKPSSPWPFFAATGFHWNFWAACTQTNAMLEKARSMTPNPFFNINCSDVQYGKSSGADTDIAAILNIFSTQQVIGDAPFPKFNRSEIDNSYTPKIIIIGDSFSDQIIHSLLNSLPEMDWAPGWLIRYDGFTSRQTFGMDGAINTQTKLEHGAALPEVLTKDLLVLEESDGVVYRKASQLNMMEHGATQELLEGLLQKGMEDPRDFLTTGWHEATKNQWHTIGSTASFAIPAFTHSIELTLNIRTQTSRIHSRLLDILRDGKLIAQTRLTSGQRILNLSLPDNIQRQDDLISEISLRDSTGYPLDIVLHGAHISGTNFAELNPRIISSPPAVGNNISDKINPLVINVISNEVHDGVLVEGLSGFESNDTGRWRWATGPATRIKFYVDPAMPDEARQQLLKLAFKNGVPIPDQAVTIRLNGIEIHRFSPQEIAGREQVDADLALMLKRGVNILELVYSDWNHGKKDYSGDSRQLAVVVTHLSLAAYPGGKKFPAKSKLVALHAPPFPAQKWPVDLFATEIREDVKVMGLSDLESNATDKWRWATGPSTRIKFYVNPDLAEPARQLVLNYAFKNGVPIPDQTVDVFLNGKTIHHFSAKEIGVQRLVEADMTLNAQKGNNVLEFRYRDCSHCKKNYGSNDPRKLAVVVMRLSLNEAKPNN